MRLGEFIKEYREKQKLSVRELGKLVDVSGPYISMIENDRIDNVPSEELLSKLSTVLKLSDEENQILDELHTNHLKDKLNKKYMTMIKNKKNIGNIGVVTEKNNGDIIINNLEDDTDDLVSLKEFSEEDKKKIIDYIKFIKFQNK